MKLFSETPSRSRVRSQSQGCVEAMVMFLAVQCYQCQTMQAKQEKKSSNKWTCAICNEKQSFTKIFSRSSYAKDIRNFVQQFNLSSHTTRQQDHPQHQHVIDYQTHITKESKWSHYLSHDDLPNQNNASQEIEVNDRGFVTSFHEDSKCKSRAKNKKRDKLSKDKSESEFPRNPKNPRVVEGETKTSKFSEIGEGFRSSLSNKTMVSYGFVRDQANDDLEISDQKENLAGNVKRPNYAKKVSKWASYLDQDDELHDGSCSNDCEGVQDLLRTELTDQIVQEEEYI